MYFSSFFHPMEKEEGEGYFMTCCLVMEPFVYLGKPKEPRESTE